MQLFFKNLLAVLLQMLARLFFSVVVGKEVNCRFCPLIVEGQVRTRRIGLMQPIQEGLGRYDDDR